MGLDGRVGYLGLDKRERRLMDNLIVTPCLGRGEMG